MARREPYFSLFICGVMDSLGYSYSVIMERRRYADIMSKKATAEFSAQPPYVADVFSLVGSKAEGLTSFWESDSDVMIEIGGIVCTDNIVKYVYSQNMTVFAMDIDDAAPGYTLIRLVQSGIGISDIFDSINESIDDGLYLPNNVIKLLNLDSIRNSISPHTQIDGPSINMNLLNCMPCDCAFAIKCEFPASKKAFVTRQRKHNQPPQELLAELSKLDTHVVAVGSKLNGRHDLEWRICDTKSELVLMRHLNETQLKVYILLKLLIKCVLQETENISDITSYVLKNIVLWMAELLPSEMFQRHLLVQLVLHALELLRQCVKRRHLPNYMMPERNMFSGKLKRQKKVLQVLTSMIDQGQAVVMMCPRLKKAMMAAYMKPDRARYLASVRDKLEIAFIKLSSGEGDVDAELVRFFIFIALKLNWQEYLQLLMNRIDYNTYIKRVFLSFRSVMM